MNRRVQLCVALAACLATAPARGGAAALLTLPEQSHICIVGNTLAERLQYDGWLETYLHARFPKHDLVIRNLGFSGDEVETRLRSKNFGTPDEWLSGKAESIGGYAENRLEGANTKADVIFAFFGYNESYAGKEGLDAFKQQLAGWIKHTLAQRYNGKSAPRIVIFSPIAHEDLGSPDLPSGKENNQRLELYTRAMEEVAKAQGVMFVDLFAPSLKAYEASKAPLTLQGVHLNTEGNRLVGQAIDQALFGAAPRRYEDAYLNRLREAVVDKNRHWFQRYRVTDGYSTYGDRAFLTFIKGNPRNVNPKEVTQAGKDAVLPSNYDVLQRELSVLDVMTGNRDRRIWAVARGTDPKGANLKTDDSDTPPLIDALTNIPGKGPDGKHVFIDGEASIQKMTVGQGLKVELVRVRAGVPRARQPGSDGV